MTMNLAHLYNPLVREPQRAKDDAVRFALAMGKKPRRADGGAVSGALLGTNGGRTDTLPITVAAGSYVIPADVVSGLPGAEGNSLAGHNALNRLFSMAPFSPDKAPYGAAATKLKPHKPNFGSHPPAIWHGGKVEERNGRVGIIAAGGEHIVPPEIVQNLGRGNIKLGHEILDEFVKEVRKRNIRDLKKLPGPVKS